MEIISPKHTSKFYYDKFNRGFAVTDDDLLLINQFHEKDQYFITLQRYELSKEWVIWVSCDLFADFQFEDIWLVFSNSETSRVESIFHQLKVHLAKIGKQSTPKLFKQCLYSAIDKSAVESIGNEMMAVSK